MAQWFNFNQQATSAFGRTGRVGNVGNRSVDLTLRLGIPREEEQVQDLPFVAQYVNQAPNPMAPLQVNLNSAGPYSQGMNQYNGTGNQRAENGGSIPPNMNSAAASFGGLAGTILGVPAYNHVPPRQPSPEPQSAAQTDYILLDVPARRARCGRRGRQHPRTYKYNNPYRRCTNYNCDTDDTPMWRRGPLGPKTLCNACGIKYRKEQRKEAADNRIRVQMGSPEHNIKKK